jgi:hypothetical protein
LPKQIHTFVDHEDMAIGYCHYQPMVMPGLLQTADYARALITGHPTLPANEVTDRVAARIERHRIFDRPAPADFTFLIHEWVVRTPTGGPKVMREQLHHLLRMGVRHNIRILMIPIANGAHVAPGGPFIFMEFANIRPVVYIEGEISGLFLEEDVEIEAYRGIMSALLDSTLDEGQSRELITRVVMDQFAAREDDHERD